MDPMHRGTLDFLLQDKVFLASTRLWKTSSCYTGLIATISLRVCKIRKTAILSLFVYGDFKGDNIKVVVHSKWIITTTAPLSANNFTVKEYLIGQRRSPHPVPILFLEHLETPSRIGSATSPWIKVVLTVFPDPPSCPSGKEE